MSEFSTHASCTVTRRFANENPGSYQPVDMSTGATVLNTVKGGSTVPMKLRLQATQANTNERTDVGAVKSFSATPYA